MLIEYDHGSVNIHGHSSYDYVYLSICLTTTVLWTISENGDKKRQWPYPEDIFWGPRGLQSCMQVRKKLVPIPQPRELILKIQQMIW